MSLRDKMLDDILHSKTSAFEVDKNIVEKDIELTSKDDSELKRVLTNELVRNGIDPSDVSTMSTTSMVVQGMMSFFERIQDSISVIKRESSILTAEKNVTLYNQLIQHTDKLTLATPSTMEVFVDIPFTEISKYGKKVGSNSYKFKFTTDNKISIDNNVFIPKEEMEIFLTVTKSSKQAKVQKINGDGTYINIPTQRIMDYYGNYHLFFKIEMVQLVTEMFERTFTGDKLERFIINTKLPIHDFILVYSDSVETTPIEIEPKLYFTRGTNNYMKYKIYNNNKITLEYVYTTDGFKPRVGGKLKICMLTTSGQNVKFRGSPDIIKRMPDNLNINYHPLSTDFISKNGKLSSSNKEDLRNQIIKYKSTRLRIDTESDFKTFLSVYDGCSIFEPRIQSSDIQRIFNVYTLLSFKNKDNVFTIPTDTHNVKIPLSKLSSYTNDDGVTSYDLPSNLVYTIPTSGLDGVLSTDMDGMQVGVPLHMSYNYSENFMRVLLEQQVDVPYFTNCVFDSSDLDLPTRFVNTTLRVNECEDEFNISTEIRSDNESFKVSDDTFYAELEFLDSSNNTTKIPLSSVIDLEQDNKYTLKFNINSEKKIFDTIFTMTASSHNGSEFETKLVYVPIKDVEMSLHLYTVYDGVKTLVETFKTSLDFFKDVTKNFVVQSSIDYNGDLVVFKAPLIEQTFKSIPRNKVEINKELLNVINFINNAVNTDDFSSTSYDLKSKQETLFSHAIKFVKTVGKSETLILDGGYAEVTNLQLSPYMKYRPKSVDCDLSRISSRINSYLISHKFETNDCHMNEILADILKDSTSYLEMLQFIKLGDEYTSDKLMLSQKSNNSSVPESMSIAPIYNEELDRYDYDIKFEQI